MKRINWKLRLQNKATLVALCGAALTFVYTVLGLFGVVPSVTQSTVGDALMAIVNVLVALGVVVDPTTQGVADSPEACRYDCPRNTNQETETKG